MIISWEKVDFSATPTKFDQLMNKRDLILAIYIVAALARLTGIVDTATRIDQLLAYLSLHAIGVILITSNEKNANATIRLIILCSASSVFIFTSAIENIFENGKVMMIVLLLLQTSFLIAFTRLFMLKFGNDHERTSIFLNFSISSNILMIYLYLLYPEYLHITKWWVFSSLFYMFYVPHSVYEFWVAVSVIAVAFVFVNMTLERTRKKTHDSEGIVG
jgi:hypothetical protein